MKWHRWIAVATLLLLVPCPRSDAASGGPDLFGYTWADSDEPGFSATPPGIPSPTDLRSLGYVGDDTVIQINLPPAVFPTGFPFYGNGYPAFWLSSNGWLSFTDPVGNSHPATAIQPDPAAPSNLVAWYWSDWTLDGSQLLEQGGINSTNDGYTMLLNIFRKGNLGTIGRVFVTLYNTGRIQIVYSVSAADIRNSTCQVGIENAAGTDGLAYMEAGVAQNGASFRNDYAVWFLPKGNLNCSGATPISCPLPSTGGSTATGSNTVSAYNCATGSWNGNERIYALTLTTAANLNIALSNTGPRNLKAFFIRPSCSEITGCVTGGLATLTPQFVAPGTYYIVVDGETGGDNGAFNLTVGCTDVATGINCGETLRGESVPATGIISNWSCAAGLGGGENIYSVTLPQPATLRATLASSTVPGGRVILADPATFTPATPSCQVASATEARMWNASGSYYVAVDGTGAGSYDLSVACERNLQCPAPAQMLSLTNPVPVAGDTTGKPSNVDTYYCADSAYAPGPLEAMGYSGPEDVYEFDVVTPTVVSFLFSSTNQDLRLLILSDCYEGSCVMEGGCSETLAPGRYRLVVDGLNGASGSYTLTPLAMPLSSYNRWTDCDECRTANPQRCLHTADEISNQNWHFDSGNFCGTGCTFSLFAVVECGSEFHIPFYDVETGHMQIFDLFQQQFVDLTATNDLPANAGLPTGCRLTDTGQLVEWEDDTCSAIPCPARNCGGGGDCQTNNVVMDVSFSGTPNVCGVYRLDFINWGGFVWDAYANCTSDRTPQYDLYRDLCSAVSAYRPLPEIGISDVTLSNAQCASGVASGTMTIENVGCLGTPAAEIIIEQAPPNPPNPQTIVLAMDKGITQVVPWSYTPSAVPISLVFRVDPGSKILECSENSGSTVSCGFNSVLQRNITLTACGPPCSTAADAGPPLLACEGAGVVLDGSASTISCTIGSAQYRWEDLAGNPISGCDWSAAAACNVPASALVPGSNDFRLRTRCQGDNPPCETSSTTSVTVTANQQPATMVNALRGVRRAADAEWSWSALIGSPITAYRLYKDAVKDVPLATRIKIFDVPLTTLLVTETNAVPDPPAMAYYQVVAASCLGDLESPY